MEKVLAFLRENPTFYLATLEGEQPRVRPFGAVALFENRLYLITNNQKSVYRQLKTNPNLELCVTAEDGAWLRVTAKAVFDSRREARVAMLEQNPSLTKLYHADDGVMEVFYLKDATAVFASFTAEPETVTF